MHNIKIFNGINEDGFRKALSRLDNKSFTDRIWKKDHTLWSSQPGEITDRLGWLTITDSMRSKVSLLDIFSQKIRESGISHVILLGMGGSSLGAEVLNRVMGSSAGYPTLIVLDSTIPETIKSVRDSVALSKSLFIVSSKSGTTAETNALFDYFYSEESSHLRNSVGRHFVAITDPGTPLAKIARERNFKHLFENPADIGGRYSILSLFGLVPAALMGINIEKLLDSAETMKKRCGPGIPAEENPGCLLGSFLGATTNCGMDKSTIITSPSLESFGLWVEQLLAESTGKEGRGIIPVIGEPLVDTKLYNGDRTFIYIRLENDNCSATDPFIKDVKALGHPVAELELSSKWELGALFYLWEYAVAIAGALIGVHPFNQPDVQSTKDATRNILNQYAVSGNLASPKVDNSISDLLSQAKKGDYFAIMAYLKQTTDSDKRLIELRKFVLEYHRIATTLGYGPRFLHSTGQLHKGGPNKGLFLQVVTDHAIDIPVPGLPYSFGLISNAESAGDLDALKSKGRRIKRIDMSELNHSGLKR